MPKIPTLRLSLDVLLRARHSLCVQRWVAFGTLNEQQTGNANPGHSKLWSWQFFKPIFIKVTCG